LVELVRDLNWTQLEIFDPSQDGPTYLTDDTSIRLEDFRIQGLDPDRMLRFYDTMGFKTMRERFVERLSKWTESSRGGQQQQMQQQQQQQQMQQSDNNNNNNKGSSSSSSSSTTSTKSSSSSRYYPKKKMGVPQLEDFKDVPF
jgi:hypothetical protein